MSPTLELTRDLISRPSVTPADGGCQEVMMKRLAAIGFRVERMNFGNVANFWAVRGRGAPVFCFAGHTDVVPTGPLEEWQTDPFVPTVSDGVLYGRGAADMKSGLAAMITATEEFVRQYPDHRGSIAFLITSDEEGPSVDGTKRVVEVLKARGERIDWCIVGEPSSESEIGDTVKIGRRGSLSGRLTVHGIQGHVAYPQLAENPVHTLAPALAELTSRLWDEGNEHFEPTTFQVSNLNAGTGAPNVIPGELKARFNLRYSPVQTVASLKETVEGILRKHGVKYTLEWYVSGEPFYTPPGPLSDAVVAAVKEVTGKPPRLSTSGGTSDGRFIAPMGAQVVELGVVNKTIHKVNENVRISEIDALHRMYFNVLRNLLT
ncbi:MAG: succinyl-diaminopimelate desuccinylase [Pseudomonadota bacterium]|jgi:succinyl-diaminopimelate desuccinylase, proteobacterial clade|nr:MAG: succinyl-diaminopimelate desuccinylase [Pseudomonadota bacterium]